MQEVTATTYWAIEDMLKEASRKNLAGVSKENLAGAEQYKLNGTRVLLYIRGVYFARPGTHKFLKKLLEVKK